MITLFKMVLCLILMIMLLRKGIQIGHTVFVSSIFLFLINEPNLQDLLTATQNTILSTTTWNMVITLYFVMCLENLLRTSGILKRFTAAARRISGSDRVLLAFMPSFLGFLPSLGGAIFSAPMVKEAGYKYNLSAELNTSINYWFRHIWQFCNPILPAILLASAITQIPLNQLIAHQLIFSLFALVLGILFLLCGKAYANHPLEDLEKPKETSSVDSYSTRDLCNSIVLAGGPILANILLILLFNMNTSLSMGLVLLIMIFILKLNTSQIKKIISSSLNFRIQWGIISILFFQSILQVTGIIDEIISFLQTSGIPVATVVCLTAFIVAFSTSIDQTYVAVTFPLIGPLSAGGSLDIVAMAYLCGTAGMMLSPTHLCLLISIEYFKADFFKSLKPIIFMEILMICFGFTYLYLF
ncbi:MAG TPA: DUF401 family protein [Peptococcaceae bacterium]|nr:DUF401 family protein [Peptococcaceae bacterium]